MTIPRKIDILVVGGGINGVGIARDAAGRGLTVLLCEKDDLGSATSSASSKLIHGGLRYLEHYEFRLVREALTEREVLLRIAPHVVRPLRFILPHNSLLRPAWMIRAGLFLYDHLAPRSRLAGSRAVDLTTDKAGEPLNPELTRGFAYADCWVDDSRLVILNALDAAMRGATVLLRHEFVSARPANDLWEVEIAPTGNPPLRTLARVLVNAAGPWVSHVQRRILGADGEGHLRLVKGSHVIVPRLHDGEEAYILQNPDRRVVFVLPFQERFSLIGTTDIPFDGDPADAAINEAEVAYLCESVRRYFKRPVSPADLIWSYAGVRPLYDDRSANPSAVTRDYVFDITGGARRPLLLSVYGGKITTYRRMAEHAMEKLGAHLEPTKQSWTARAPLPGGDFPDGAFEPFLSDLLATYPHLPRELLARYARAYGNRTSDMLAGSKSQKDLGRHFGGGLFEREVEYLVACEWAQTRDDILWRRSKLGLRLTAQERNGLEQWLDARKGRSTATSGDAPDLHQTRADQASAPRGGSG